MRRRAGPAAGRGDLSAVERIRGRRNTRPGRELAAGGAGDLPQKPSGGAAGPGREPDPKEFDILWFLAQNRGEVFTKEQIYRAVWSDNYLLDDSNIMAFIRKLRKKIEPDPDAPRYILTLWGIGYKFNDQL